MTNTNHGKDFSLSAVEDVLYDDQSAQLTKRVICDDYTARGALPPANTRSPRSNENPKNSPHLRQNDARPIVLESTPLLTKRTQHLAINQTPSFYVSKVIENVGKLPKYVSIVDYKTTTTTTTTKTKLTPRLDRKSGKIGILPSNFSIAVAGNNSENLRHANVMGISPYYSISDAVSSDNEDEEEDENSLSKPLLLILKRYDHEKVVKTNTTTAKARIPSLHSEITTSESINEKQNYEQNENFQQKSILKHPQKQQTAVCLANAKLTKSGSEGERETWENKTDFLLSVIGFAVDLANVWRFPYLCFKNGGGAFLIPYVLMVFLAGIPLFYMELALGQYHRKGAITTWGKICPLFKGIGYCVIMTAFYTDFFYNVIIAFALHYFFASFTTVLPWTLCSNSYNSPACYEPSWSSDASSRECATVPVFINSTALNSSFRAVSAAEEYFYKYFLGLHEEKEPVAHVVQSLSNLGSINWELVACVMAVYLICYFSLWKGIKMSGKVVWFTAIFPYVVLGVLLVRGITLPGWEKGIEYYLKPNLEMLKMPSVWQDAATQVFFSLGPGFGVLLAYSSYNEFHNNVYFDALLTSSINCMTSFLAGFVIFSVLGYMSCKSGKPIHEVAQEGPGLAFVVYPEALATMPGASLWSIAFFLMLLTLGLDSSFGGSEAIITGLGDEFPIIKRNREIFVAILFIFYMMVGMVMCTRGGMLVMEWLIFYGTAWGLLIAVFCETMVISFCYGIKQFSEDIREMLGFAPGWYWKICWAIGAPSFLIAMIMSSFINYQSLQYQDYVYSPTANMFGLLFALSSASAIPIVGIYTWYKQPGDTCLEKLRLSLIPLKRRRSSCTITTEVAGPSSTVAPTVIIDYGNRCESDTFMSYPHSNDIML